MPSAFQLMPSLEGDEMAFVQELIKDMDESHAQQFAIAYMSRRKDPNNMLLFAIIGFLGIAGIQRFVINEVGMGIVPDNKLAREFRDVAGKMNQQIAGISDKVYMIVSGIPIKVK